MVAMVTGGEEEEGVISDPGTEIMSNQDEKVKVSVILLSMSCVHVCPVHLKLPIICCEKVMVLVL